MFVGLAGGAGGDVGFDRVMEARPVEVRLEAVYGFLRAEVACNGNVVGFLEEGGVEGGGNVELVGGGIEEVLGEVEVRTRAREDRAKDSLVCGILGSLPANIVEEGRCECGWGTHGC
jgi:hypothetical protein